MLVPNELLRAARIAADLSQIELAAAAGLDKGTVVRSEANERMTQATLAALRDALVACGMTFEPSAGDLGPGLRLPPGNESELSVLTAAADAIGLSVDETAAAAKLSGRTLVRARSAGSASAKTLSALRAALEKKGVLFVEADGGHGAGFRIPLSMLSRDDLRF
ncbi:helix-turn-helix domain-containing protein [Tianweitania sediminis]|uniref:Helix-turn-helix transcriptional regulator n=1 Tax=Tianweitania sediminis TaxID=1502156 RepID=A0A8J7UK38_9HYPH|nr:helix-turn-helix transcriptional regulator [Tianweitania sediminis]